MGEKEYGRAERVADQIQRALAEIIAREVSDPRLERVTVSSVDLSRDLRNAKAYVTLPEGADREGALRALDRASGFIRKRLAEHVRLKFLPKLHFTYDETLDRALRVSALLDAAKRKRGDDDDA